MNSRLDSQDRRLADWIRELSIEEARAIAGRAALAAVDTLGLDLPVIEEGRAAVQSRAPGIRIQAELTRLTEELDEIAWRIQDSFEVGDGDGEPDQEYLGAFRRARAVSALSFALELDDLTAALEATYEAIAAMGRDPVVRSIGYAPPR